jgi:hypothetical protein
MTWTGVQPTKCQIVEPSLLENASNPNATRINSQTLAFGCQQRLLCDDFCML